MQKRIINVKTRFALSGGRSNRVNAQEIEGGKQQIFWCAMYGVHLIVLYGRL